MATSHWRTVQFVDGLYPPGLLLVTAVVLTRHEPAGTVHTAMALFGVFVGLEDWAMARKVLHGQMERVLDYVMVTVLTVVVLALVGVLATRPPAELPLYLGVLAGVALVQAVRGAVVLDLSVLELLLQGYVTLVVVYPVLLVLARRLEGFDAAILIVAVAALVFNRLFSWTGTLIRVLVGRG